MERGGGTIGRHAHPVPGDDGARGEIGQALHQQVAGDGADRDDAPGAAQDQPQQGEGTAGRATDFPAMDRHDEGAGKDEGRQGRAPGAGMDRPWALAAQPGAGHGAEQPAIDPQARSRADIDQFDAVAADPARAGRGFGEQGDAPAQRGIGAGGFGDIGLDPAFIGGMDAGNEPEAAIGISHGAAPPAAYRVSERAALLARRVSDNPRPPWPRAPRQARHRW